VEFIVRIFSGGLATETNTFGPMPTGLAAFHGRCYYRAGEHPDAMTLFSGPLLAARARCKEHGWTLAEGMLAAAEPSGITTRAAYETLRDELLADLRTAMPVDVVVLGLHGAMVADGYDDCEGDLLARVREIVGPKAVIGAELDPHNHLTPAMLQAADLLISFKQYPHTDVLERGFELVDICTAAAQGRVRPVAAVADTDMISVIHTTREPARGFVERICALEGKDGVLSISITHGFPWGDVAEMGTKILVYTDGDEKAAQTLADKLAGELRALRGELCTPALNMDEAIALALGPGGWPVVLADTADNPGGGAAGDSTFLLRELFRRQVRDVAVGPFWDPGAVALAFEAGAGAQVSLRIGGKVGPLSGDPLDLPCVVKALHPDLIMTGLANSPTSMGRSALVESAGIEIALVTVRVQAMGTDLFTNLGCRLEDKKLIVVKSSQHFYADFSKIARRVLYVSGPGTLTSDLSTLPYRKVRRPKWPLDPSS
jgi:microcystin degradation protein MlrC